MTTSRRNLLAASVLAMPMLRTRPARAADFTIKYAHNNPPTHPLAIRAAEAAAAIGKETQGRVQLQIFPNSQLGGDTQMLSQLRSGAIQMFTLGGNVLSTLVPMAAITGMAFSFRDYDAVWAALDGDLGEMVRTSIKQVGLTVLDKAWDNGFRQITSSNRPIQAPADLMGFKIRIPVSPVWTSTFTALGASPLSLAAPEMYSALQTKVADGQENSLTIISTYKLYEVQKYCSLSNHMWEGYWMLANGPFWAKLPEDVRTVVATHMNAAALLERADVAKQGSDLRQQLEAKGLAFNEVDQAPFKAKLLAAKYYSEWEAKFGPAAWSVFSKAVGTPA